MPLMTIFEPLFLLLALAAVVVLVRAAVAAIRGRGDVARRALARLGIATVIYMLVVFAVSAAMPRRDYRIGDTRCFDDWCIAVTSAGRPAPTTVTVGLRLSSRAKRVPQRERGTVVYLIDSAGRRYDPVGDASVVPLDTMLQPGQSVDASRTFAVAADARGLGLVYTRQGGFPIGTFIIGENEWVHGPPVVRLDSAVNESSSPATAGVRDVFPPCIFGCRPPRSLASPFFPAREHRRRVRHGPRRSVRARARDRARRDGYRLSRARPQARSPRRDQDAAGAPRGRSYRARALHP